MSYAVDFPAALTAVLYQGKTATRCGWNGNDMFIFRVDGSTFEVNRAPLNEIFAEGTKVDYQPHIDMRTANGSIVPWLASQSDLFAKDWVVADKRESGLQIEKPVPSGDFAINTELVNVNNLS